MLKEAYIPCEHLGRPFQKSASEPNSAHTLDRLVREPDPSGRASCAKHPRCFSCAVHRNTQEAKQNMNFHGTRAAAALSVEAPPGSEQTLCSGSAASLCGPGTLMLTVQSHLPEDFPKGSGKRLRRIADTRPSPFSQ